MNKILIALGCIIITSTLILNLTGCKKVVVKVPEIKNVKVVEAVISSINTTIEYACKLKPINEIVISPKTPGKVSATYFIVGDKVSRDDILFTLETKDIQSQIEQQKAGVELSRVNLEKTKDSGLEQQIAVAEQGVKRAQISYDTVKTSYDKTLESYQRLEISKVELTDADTKIKNALNELNSAKDNLKILKEKSGPQSVNVATAQLKQSEAGVSSLMAQLDNTIIRSPIAGIVSVKNVDVGEMSQANLPSYTIIDTKEMIAEVSASDKMIGKIKSGQIVPIQINAVENKKIDGLVESISPAADDKTQTYTIRIRINNEEDLLKSGMFARVVLPAESRENILTIPNESIKIETGIKYVYIVENEKVKKVAVSTGLNNSKITEILTELKSGNLVITEGQIFLNEGETVKVVQ